jgi:hypothetical protein
MTEKVSKNSRVSRRVTVDVPKKKVITHFIIPKKPGKPVRPIGSYESEAEAIAAQKNFDFPTTVVENWK